MQHRKCSPPRSPRPRRCHPQSPHPHPHPGRRRQHRPRSLPPRHRLVVELPHPQEDERVGISRLLLAASYRTGC